LNAGEQPRSFFGDAELDASLPVANSVFWAALLDHIEQDTSREPAAILDFGCHSGGLLTLLGQRFPAARLIGIEPLATLRVQAASRLYAENARTTLLGDWHEVGEGSVDLLVCHEVLYLLPDLERVLRDMARCLAPRGTAWVVLGCHSENPVWAEWKALLVAGGTRAYDHSPFDLLTAASKAGMVAQVQPLRRTGWVRYDPSAAVFPFPDARSMFEHHYRHKLLFRLGLDDDGFTSPS
jgi:SAM-dependent methyltransferase